MPRDSSGRPGDGTERFPRRHSVNGDVCPGVFDDADWVDVTTSADSDNPPDQLPSCPEYHDCAEDGHQWAYDGRVGGIAFYRCMVCGEEDERLVSQINRIP